LCLVAHSPDQIACRPLLCYAFPMNYNQLKKAHPEVTALFDRLQAVYSKREYPLVESPRKATVNAVKDLFTADATLLVFGTEAGEIFEGSDEIARLLYWDLAEWGDIDYRFCKAAVFRVRDKMGWAATQGTCTMSIEPDVLWRQLKDDYIPAIQNSSLSEQEKNTEIQKYRYLITAESSRGSNYSWPFRFTGIFEQAEIGWRFGHMHFSYPSGLLPWYRTDSVYPYPDKEKHPFFRPIPEKPIQL
jgi:hypothetical protein